MSMTLIVHNYTVCVTMVKCSSLPCHKIWNLPHICRWGYSTSKSRFGLCPSLYIVGREAYWRGFVHNAEARLNADDCQLKADG